MGSSLKVLQRMDSRVRELSEHLLDFEHYFESTETFSGPSLYFHQKAIQSLRSCKSLSEAVLSDDFYDWIYATLASWGMHRMGKNNTKLRNLNEIKLSVREQISIIKDLQHLSLTDLRHSNVEQIGKIIWTLISNIRVSVAEAKIGANSKLLHHILPDLIPPIDRTYTFNFFYDRNMLSIPEEDAFSEIFQRLHKIAAANKDHITSLIDSSWNTSSTKVIDNAIVGYVLKTLRL